MEPEQQARPAEPEEPEQLAAVAPTCGRTVAGTVVSRCVGSIVRPSGCPPVCAGPEASRTGEAFSQAPSYAQQLPLCFCW